eukprot:jgi/Psemu1/19269/gm1.19269_g
MEEDSPTRSQEIEIAFSAAAASDDEESSDKESSMLSNSSSSSSSSSGVSSSASSRDNKKKYRYKMVLVYTDGQVPKLDKGDAGKFEDWYTQFQAYADKHKYGDMLSTKAHKDLPPEGQLTPWEDMSKAQKKAFKYHNTAQNDLYKAFSDNSRGLAIMEKSKIDQGGSAETNAKLRMQWPWGRVHRVIEELTREYRRKNRSHDREQLNINLRGLKLAIGAPPQDLIEDIYDLQQKYQYKSVSPTLDELFVAFKAALPPYLLMQLTPIMDELQDADTSELELWEVLNLKATSLYQSARSVQSRGGKAKEMSLLGAEMTDFGSANPDKRDKWATNAVCYWCKEKGHKAYNCKKCKAGHPRVDKKAENTTTPQRARAKCGLCGGKHKDANCWEDAKNAAKRPAGWRSKLKDVQGATIDYDFCLLAMQTSTTSLQLLNAQKRATKRDVLPKGFDLLYDDNVFVFDTGATSHSSNSMRCATNLRASGATITTQSGDELKGCQIGDIPCQKIDKDGNKEYQTLLQGVNFNPNFAFNLFSATLALQNDWIATGSDKAGWSLWKGNTKVNFDIQIPTYISCVWVGYFERIANPTNNLDISAATATTTTSEGTQMNINKAHQLLGHMDETKTRRTAAALSWTITRGAMQPCEDCAKAKAKAKRKVIPTESEHQAATKPGERLFLDMSSVKPPKEAKSNKLTAPFITKPHFRMIVDEYSSCRFANFFASKDGMVEPTCALLNQWRSKGQNLQYI